MYRLYTTLLYIPLQSEIKLTYIFIYFLHESKMTHLYNQEYIEEVEEWEEEEEVPEELTVTSGVAMGGLVTGVKARLKAAATPALPLQPGKWLLVYHFFWVIL